MELVFSTLVGFSLFEKTGIPGDSEVAGSLVNHRSLVFRPKKSELSSRNVLEHCRDGGANCLLTTTPVSSTAQHHVDDGGRPCSTLW